ncbi:MAG: glycosyltransferase family 8 protein [Holosporales bacterium]|jgi:lipopolysaccharide biosynthesis glycosyltransferase|nr:glycosyltransferase family 8 protein [Holosporales bacterium]
MRTNLIEQEKPLPAFKNNNVLVVFASDENYAMPLGVTIQSLMDNSSIKNNYDIWVLDSGIPDEDKKVIVGLIDGKENFSIRFFDISKIVEEYKDRFFTSEYITVAVYNRLFIPNIFYQYKRALYLDCDIAVKADVAELYNVELDGKCVGAVLEARCNEEHGRKIIGDKWKEYFNSGVLVFNIKKLLKNNFFGRCIEYLKANPEPITWDQDTLNAVCAGDVQLINERWNTLNMYSWYVTEKTKNSFIVHYADRVKPWNGPTTLNAADIWWSYAIKTPFYEKIIEKNNLNKRKLEKRFGLRKPSLLDRIMNWFDR